MIELYSFGLIKINGKTYSNDLIIFSDHVKANWWRKKGHKLHPDDISEIIDEKVELLIVGTGAYGKMKIPTKTRQFIESYDIELIVKDTEKACITFNEMINSKKVAAALHLTC